MSSPLECCCARTYTTKEIVWAAGTEKHELTSWKSFHSIFKFFSDALKDHEDESSSSPVTTRSSHRIKNEDL
ncbi:protein FAM172A isoform X1 [Labeo rohita]|uniref:Protein FAM172A isoform X1 n=1 Tax=Labeo rohita TaxID=84645 RepID=A0A498NQR2_LABRO|nr:protein FAM172A isoform X1 [Labeo rohita]